MSSVFEVTNILKEYFYAKTGTCQRSYDSEYGKEPAWCTAALAHQVFTMDSMVALYRMSNSAKRWKVFVVNRGKKIEATTGEL